MKSNHGVYLALFATAMLGACSVPTVVPTVKPSDDVLSCAQLQSEYVEAEGFRAEADKEKGVSGGNIAKAILFWPSVLGSVANANEAIAAAEARKKHLVTQMNRKRCAIPTFQTVSIDQPMPSSQPVPISPPDTDVNLIMKD